MAHAQTNPSFFVNIEFNVIWIQLKERRVRGSMRTRGT